MASNIDRLCSALSYLDPNMGRDDWVTVAMGIKSSLGEAGLDIFEDWSKGGDAYNSKDVRDTWKSINGTGGVTEATVFYMARAVGWHDDGIRHEPTPEEQEVRRRKAEKAEAKKARERAQAAGKAASLWQTAQPAPADNPYLTRKGVAPVATLREIPVAEAAKIFGYPPKSRGETLVGNLLVVPVTVAGALSTLELIDGDGRKHALADGAKSGGYWAADPLPEGDEAGLTLVIGEGVATVLSAREATGYIVIAALSSGNLLAVAREMRQRYPKAVLVVLADLIKTTGEPDPHAIEAADAVGGTHVVPRFPEPRDPSHTDMNDLAAVCGTEAVRDLIYKGEGTESPSGQDSAPNEPEWPEPLAPEAYHGLAGEMVKAIEPHTESDPAALLVQVLVAFGVLIGRTPYFQVEGDKHYANLYAVLVGLTSKGRKGTSWGRIRSFFEGIYSWVRVLSGLSSGEGLKWQVRDPPPQKPKKKRFKKRRHWQDPDFEGEDDESEDPGVTDKRLLVIEPEFASVLRVASRKGNTLTAAMRDGWDRGYLGAMTKNDPITATDTHISIMGHVTADELRSELTYTDTANGFANRFLFLCVRRSKCLPFGGEDLPDTDFARRLERAATAAQRVGRVEMTEAARGIWKRVYPSLSEGKAGLFGAATARAEAQTRRLALLYALLDEKSQVDVPHLEAALAVWRGCEASARYVFGASLGDPTADEILCAVRAAGARGLTRTQVSGLFQRHYSAGQIGSALDLLVRQKLIRRHSKETGGRPVEVWVCQ